MSLEALSIVYHYLLNPTDLIIFGRVCRFLNLTSHNRELWSKICKKLGLGCIDSGSCELVSDMEKAFRTNQLVGKNFADSLKLNGCVFYNMDLYYQSWCVDLRSLGGGTFFVELCNNLPKHVRHLDILSFSGRLPYQIWNLPNLEKLEINHLSFDEVPREVTKLTKLFELRISNGFFGCVIPSIRKLSVVKNGFEQLSDMIWLHTNLCELVLRDDNITTIPHAISKMSNLEILDLESNSLQQIEVICGLTSLQKLSLGHNPLKCLPKSIGNLSNLRELNLDKTHIRDFPESFRNLPLEKLSFTNSRETEIQEIILGLTNLKELNMAGSIFLNATSNSITKLKNLEILDLSGCQTRSFQSLPNLKVLNLCAARLCEVPGCIYDLASLQEVDLSHNLICKVESCLCHLTNLSKLKLNNNKLTSFPELRFTNLKELDLGYNNFEKFPESLCNLHLTKLNLEKNDLSELPALAKLFKELTNLEYLNLEGNALVRLSGHFGKFVNLTTLNLRGNKLHDLPKTFGELSNLKTLIISKNQLSKIPESLCNLPNVTELKLGYNNINQLPNSFTKLTSLRYLELDNNRLEKLSDDLSHLTNLGYLNVNCNRLKTSPIS